MTRRFPLLALLLLAAPVVLGMAMPSQRRSAGEVPRADFVPVPMELLPVLERAREVGPTNPEHVLNVSVSLSYGDPEGMQAFVDSVSDPKSPNYRRFITPEEVGDRFGRPESEVRDVVNYLVRSGFHIRLVAKNRLAVLADATVAEAEAAFHTRIREFTVVPENDVEPSTFFAYTGPVYLPKGIAGSVIDITGLESYTRPQHRVTLLTPTLTRGLYDTANLFTANIKGQGRTVAISNFVGFRISNAVAYVNHFALPVPGGGAGSNITVVPISGGAGSGADNAEGDLDIQMELGMAPLANIRVYDGGNNDLIGTLTQEVNDNLADTISESYGWNIPGGTAGAAHNLHLSMSAQGITYMAASGDSGTSLEPFSYPNYEPEVLLIGGTTANVNSSTGARVTEVGWSGSGGGWSTKTVAFNVRPPWQTGTGVLPLAQANKRLSPDIAFHSSGSSGSCGGSYQFYTGNGALQNGFCGTSFASPVFAGLLAIVEQKVISLGGLPADGAGHRRFGRIQDLIYSQNGRTDIWFDITTGANGNRPDGSASTCTAKWDTVTGWGAMDCQAFANLVGCGNDADGDGTPDCTDGCPNDPNKTAPGVCGCGFIDSNADSDGDGTVDCTDGCPFDPAKTSAGQCGCGVADTDSDSDGTANCHDGCPNDPAKLAPGQCGCGIADTDTDGDGTANCNDGCPNDPAKTTPGQCGCGVADTDSDGDGTPNCHDGCPSDPNKTAPGACGCGIADVDSDGDGTLNCFDGCPNDPNKIAPGVCGCGLLDTDTDADGVADCNDNCPSIANADQEDCNFDGNGDVCEIDAGAPDCNSNGRLDSCEIGEGSVPDVNHDGIPDGCQSVGTGFCFGDGSGSACPCGNSGASGHGCANSVGQSAQLSAVGTTSPDTVKLYVTGELPTSFSMFLQGTASVGPFLYGDGLRCVGGTFKRLYHKNASGGNVSAPQGAELSITSQSAALGDPIPSGATRYYIVSYRDPNPSFCPAPPGGTFNATNSLSIVW